MSRLAVLVVLAATVFPSCGGHSGDACQVLREHRDAIRERMAAVDGNDDASIAAYNRLVAKASADFRALEAKGCTVVSIG